MLSSSRGMQLRRETTLSMYEDYRQFKPQVRQIVAKATFARTRQMFAVPLLNELVMTVDLLLSFAVIH